MTFVFFTLLQSPGHPVAHALPREATFLPFLGITWPENLGDDELPIILVGGRKLFSSLGTTEHFEDGQCSGDGSSHLFSGPQRPKHVSSFRFYLLSSLSKV